ncbi:cupin domain-containing protein [Spirillospora sp. CA-253888]
MTVIRSADARRTETPNGVMTTLASPTQGGTGIALWQSALRPGATGPRHAFDAEQVWTCLAGSASVELDGERLTVAEGDTLVLPADLPRRMTAGPDGFTAVVTAPAGTRAYNPVPAEADACDLAPKGEERLVPLWVR